MTAKMLVTIRRSGLALVVLMAGLNLWSQAPATAEARFTEYTATLESRLAGEHQSQMAGVDRERARKGEVVIEKLIPAQDADPPGGMLHDWRGTAFAPGAKAADFERLLRDFPAYSKAYEPEVVKAAILSQQGDHYTVTMRVKQKHVITVVMDTAYDVEFGHSNSAQDSQSDAPRGWSTSRSTEIKEIENAGTEKERALGPKEEHGFLWRLNTYWTYEERDGGLYLQIESVSLTRAIPAGFAWAVRPFVESVPRESLEFTLRKTCEALRPPAVAGGGAK
jgi:hypothetical protein